MYAHVITTAISHAYSLYTALHEHGMRVYMLSPEYRSVGYVSARNF